jgi:hypothetical protein
MTQRELARRSVPSVVHHGPIESIPGRPYVIGGGDGYVVVHRNPVTAPVALWLRARRVPIVVVDVQPFKAMSWRWGGITVPMTFDTSILGGLVASAVGVVSFSLHLAIFAIATGTPVAVADTGDHRSRKMLRYLARAGIGDRIVGRRNVSRLLDTAIDPTGMAACSDRERRLATEHLDHVARACAAAKPVSVGGR